VLVADTSVVRRSYIVAEYCDMRFCMMEPRGVWCQNAAVVSTFLLHNTVVATYAVGREFLPLLFYLLI